MISASKDRQRTLGSRSFGETIARRIVLRRMESVRRGEIRLEEADGVVTIGESADLRATLQIRSPRFYRDLLTGGSLEFAAAYFRGDWDCDDLTALFRIFVRNLDRINGMDQWSAWLANQFHRYHHWRRANSFGGSRENIRAHYDLGNDFFQLWLDETMAYSSGIFANPGDSLAQASVEKFDRVCRKLELSPSDRILEIGSGWGGFAVHAAREYGCHVTTTTISKAQYEAAASRIRAANLGGRIELLLRDYRDLSGQFDKLVSIEMIEAVGHERLDEYFRQCGRLLKPGGTFLLQAIVMPEQGYDDYLRGVDFIQRYVFPGGCLPSTGSILQSVGLSCDLRLVHFEDFAPHYAETLRRWRQSFEDRIEDVERLGYDKAFQRLWRYYLCYCEAVFEERRVGVAQILFDKPGVRRDPLLLSRFAATS